MVEEEYIVQIAGQLRNFKKTHRNKYSFSCPICGDSKRDPRASRGNFFLHKGEWIFHCYNCNASHKFSTFLKTVFPELYDQFIYDNFGYSKKKKITLPTPKIEKPKFNVKANTLKYLEDASANPKALAYCLDRGFTHDMVNELYYARGFKQFVNTHLIKDKFENPKGSDQRLVIPFFSEDNELIGVQGRSLDPTNPVKYITIKLIGDDEELIYGMNKIDKSKTVYVLEGPFDSMFIENGVAFAGSSLGTITGVTNRVLVWDNEPRNKEIKKLQLKAIRANEAVVIWPKLNSEKDVNDMILSGMNVDAKYLENNTYQGLEAQLQFNQWIK